MNSGDGNYTFTNADISNHLKPILYDNDSESHMIDNRGDSSDMGKVLDNNFSERLANFMKNSKSLLENIEKKHSNVRFEKFEKSATKATCIMNEPETPAHTLVELQDTLMKLDDSKLRSTQKINDKFTTDGSEYGIVSIDFNEKENISELSCAEKNIPEKETTKYVANKNYNFKEALRIDQLESELYKMKSCIKERDKKINVLESAQRIPERTCKPVFKSIGADVNTGHYESVNLVQKQKNEMYSDKIIQDVNYSIKCDPYNGSSEYLSIKDYDPNNSCALRNKIKDLEYQIQDLQEANENAAQFMTSLKQNSVVETNTNTNAIVLELIDKNKVLREEVDRLHQSVQTPKSDTVSSQFLRKELENLKEDLYTLKHQNNLIVMENITLKNQLKKERNLELHNKCEDHKLISHRSNEPHKQYESNFNGVYDLNNHHKDVSDTDNSMDLPFTNILSNNQNKAMSMTNLTLHSSNLHALPKKVGKMLPTSLKQKETMNIYHLPEFEEEAFLESGRAVDRVLSEKCSYGRHETDLSNDSTDSMLSDANKEVQEIIFKSELDDDIQNFSTRSNYEKDFESDLSIEKSLFKKETLIKDAGFDDQNKFSTLGRTAYAPRSSYDIDIGDVVKFIRQGGRISRGLVHFVGPLPNRKDTYLGIELEVEDGKHDGIYEGKRYFQCIKSKGVFVAFNKIIMVYSAKI